MYHLAQFPDNTMEGGKKMTPHTTLLTHFYANDMEGGLMPRTAHLTRFSTNTAAGGALNVLPDALSQQYLVRWEENDTPDRPPDSLFNEYRGRWCIRCIT